jgi:excisionase family DNA binding protein
VIIHDGHVADTWLSTKEAAGYLGVSERWLRDSWQVMRIKAKNIAKPGAKLHRWRFKKSDLDRWIESQTKGTVNVEEVMNRHYRRRRGAA